MTAELEKFYSELGITSQHLHVNQLPFCEQADLSTLQIVDIDVAGRPFVLTAETAVAWKKLRDAATTDKVVVNPASGFRSFLFQKLLIERLINSGRQIDEILTSTAIPGFSEHHTGCAMDLCADPKVPEGAFHQTKTFEWMLKNAEQFGFRLSYPRNNSYGMIFEPWHWFYKA